MGRHVGGRARRGAAAPARPAPRPPGRAHRPRGVGVGQGPQGRLPRGRPPRAHRALLRAHRPRAPRHPSRRRHVPGADAGRGQPCPQGCRRHHLAVELPAHPRALRRPARAAGGQRGGGQARRADDADRAAGRAAARRGRLPVRALAGRGRPRAGGRRRRGRGRRLRLLHRLDRHGTTDRAAVRRPAHRLLARAGRQEPDAGAARRRRAARRRGRRTRGVLQRRAALRLDRAALRRRPGLRPLRRRLRLPHPGADPRGQPRLERRHGVADLAGPARRRHRARRGRGRQGRRGCSRAARPAPTWAPSYFEPTILEGVIGRHGVLRPRDVRPGGLALPLPRRGRGGRASQRRALRAQRLHLHPRRGARTGARPPDPLRDGQRQRGLRRHLRLARCADGWHERLRDGPAPGCRGHPALHRGAVGRDPASGADRADVRHVGGDPRQGAHRLPAAAQQAGRA